VTEARAKVGTVQMSKDALDDPKKFEEFQAAQNSMSSCPFAAPRCRGKVPELKANQSFMDLQHQLEGTENRINVARTRYNKAVETFNGSIRTFPNNLTNRFLLHLKPKEPFKAAPGAEKAPQVKF